MKLIVLIVIFYALSLWSQRQEEQPQIIIKKQQNAKNFNTYFLSSVSLGNKRLVADLLWIQTLIESDLEHYQKDDLNDWIYLRFDSIIKMDPRFLQAYQYGGQYLSIIKDDALGAKDIYQRGLAVYPDDYFLNFNAGFHYFFELGDEFNAHALFEKIQFLPQAPKNLPSIVAKFKARRGNLKEAYALMMFAFERTPNESVFIKQSFRDSIESIQIEMDLDCLNSKKTCALNPPKGYRYILKNGFYVTNKSYKKFGLAKKYDKELK